ncbi:phenylalanine--tRNA ligase subunit alpha [Estrella lausannensis]|uniref:Phenylalanine--tRNA ligase alpha subunit n=1 Tax=Estrella lausannensis TaxID=483423 RepID=A0A0H5DSE6_9BACT|nr:phenylalanine--tRNA ligase subunit alpha [Estrella lausannensis]CRX38689.1 Phenylalanyl-tRNA synthetase alpha chain [Estrella lausannensis]
MLESIKEIELKFHQDISHAATTQDLEAIKVKYLGKKGPLQDLMKELKDVSQEHRPAMGKLINDLKGQLEKTLSEAIDNLIEIEEDRALKAEAIDVTLPGRAKTLGRRHVISHALEEILDILISMGFSVEGGPEIDTDYYNFEALNFPPEHPARDLQDTFYISSDVLLRTHTSNIQARVMEKRKPPIRIIAPGKCYRNESVTARSHVFFHQVEAIYIDKNVSFSDLIATLELFIQRLFHKEIKMRFRPSYFPFVEPGLELDIHCLACNGAGCPICKHTGWLEIAGAGMVHPEVLINGGIDPEEYSGFAWGMGIERLVMLKYGIRDIRIFSENDQRFLNQYSSL